MNNESEEQILVLTPDELHTLRAAVQHASEEAAHGEADNLDLWALLALRQRLGTTPTTWTFSARKARSEDWCRGCHMTTYPADSRRETGLTRQQVIDRLAELRLVHYGPGEAKWDAHGFADGPTADGPTGEETGLEGEVKARAQSMMTEQNAVAERKATEAKALAAKAQRIADEAELARLRVKLGR